MTKYTEWLATKRHTTPNLDTASLDAVEENVRRYFRTDRRVRVETTWDDGETYIRTGRISVTTGWRPAFLLVHRSSDTGSSDVLGPRDRVTHVQHGRTYVPVSNIYQRH